MLDRAASTAVASKPARGPSLYVSGSAARLADTSAAAELARLVDIRLKAAAATAPALAIPELQTRAVAPGKVTVAAAIRAPGHCWVSRLSGLSLLLSFATVGAHAKLAAQRQAHA